MSYSWETLSSPPNFLLPDAADANRPKIIYGSRMRCHVKRHLSIFNEALSAFCRYPVDEYLNGVVLFSIATRLPLLL